MAELREQSFSHTVNDGTNDLVDLAILDRAGAGEPLAQSRGEGTLDGLEGRVEGCRAAKGLRGPQRGASEAAVQVRVSMRPLELPIVPSMG